MQIEDQVIIKSLMGLSGLKESIDGMKENFNTRFETLISERNQWRIENGKRFESAKEDKIAMWTAINNLKSYSGNGRKAQLKLYGFVGLITAIVNGLVLAVKG